MPSFAMGKELAGLGGLFNRFVAAPLTGAALFNQGRSGSTLDQGLKSIPSTRKTDAGRALGNVLGNEMRYMGSQLQRGSLPYLGNEMRYVTNTLTQGRNPYGKPLNAIQTGKYGPTDWNPNANPLASVPSGGAADRAYQQEKARVTQMTEQDPMFKKYQVAELSKQYNAAKGDEREKIGMQIWAATNPTLAKKVPPGQVGYQTSASMFGSQAFGTDVPGVTETIYSQAGQQEGVPGGVQFPGSEQVAKMPVFSMGADAQQLGVTPPGTAPFPMIGENVFKRGFEVPSSEDLSQTQLALLKRAFESRIK
jgi:hypothetical protein